MLDGPAGVEDEREVGVGRFREWLPRRRDQLRAAVVGGELAGDDALVTAPAFVDSRAVEDGTRYRSGRGISPASSDETPVCRVSGATAIHTLVHDPERNRLAVVQSGTEPPERGVALRGMFRS